MKQPSLGILPHRIGQMTFENKRLEVIGNISEELTPSIFRVCAQLKGPPPPIGLPCPYTSLFVTYHLLLFIQNSDKRFLYNTGTHTTRQHPRRQCSSLCSKFEGTT